MGYDELCRMDEEEGDKNELANREVHCMSIVPYFCCVSHATRSARQAATAAEKQK